MDWPMQRLGDLCNVQLGKTPPRGQSRYWDKDRKTDNVWLSIADLVHGEEVSESKEYITDQAADGVNVTPAGTLLLSFKLTIGRVSFAGRDLYTNEAIASLLNLSPKLDKRFLFYFFSAFDWDTLTEGDIKLKGKTLNKAKLNELPIPLPPLLEQQRIVGKLDSAFAALMEAQAHVKRNQANARELFESYLNGGFEGKGDGWQEYTLPELAENLDSRRVPITKSDRKAGPYPYYGASGIVDHVHDFIFDEECLLISEDGANLLMRSTPIAFSVNGKYWVNNHAHILRFRERATQRLVEHYLESIDLSPWITGAAQPKLNQSAMNSIPIRLPKDLKERGDLVNKLDELQRETKALEATYERKLRDLEGLKKGLLWAAFRGDL
jgi:type I restriction enzyme S subunit